jgi:hypothetical protein
VPDDPTVAGILARCGAAAARALGGDEAALEAGVADLYRLPDDLPARGPLAAGLVTALVLTGRDRGPQRLRHLDGLLEIADRNPPATPGWPRIRSTARLLAHLRAGADRERFDTRAVLAEMEGLLATAGDNPTLHALYDAMRTGMNYLQALDDGDRAGQRVSTEDIARLRNLGAHKGMGPLGDYAADALALIDAHQRDDGEARWQAWERLQAASARLGPGSHLQDVVAEIGTFLEPMRGLMGADATMPSAEQLAALDELTQRPGISDTERAVFHTAAGAAALGGGQETDPGRIDAAVESFRAAVAGSPPDDPQRAFHLQSLGMGLLRRAEVTGRTSDLDDAARVLEQARDLAGGPAHPLWSLSSETLAYVQMRRGERSGGRRVGLEGLRSFAWDVLLQSDLPAARAAARDAADGAIEIARWCLVDGDPADAVRALDAGRGLMLFAATELRDVTARLDDAGRPDLAERWREATANAAVPTDLRREVLAVLTARPDLASGLLDPPGLPEIRAALAALDADALVYLVPGRAAETGWAVISPVDGPPGYLALPNLLLDKEPDVERALHTLSGRDTLSSRDTLSGRDAGPADPEDGTAEAFLGSVESLCDWAWRAAIGPLLERYVASRPAPGSGRVPRLVLVPMGVLARIPWQAARRGDGTYAVELAAFSQTVSARTLCGSSARPPVPLAPLGLVVGDPDTSDEAAELVAARAEAYAIHQAFYRGARYLGRRPDGSPSRSGAGTGAQVRDWLTGTRPGAGAMLHLACHGYLRADPESGTSYLLLAGGDRLTAEELIALPDRATALVVLAACRTGMSAHGYDEAYSLGTAFLAGGARSVLSTQWSIPDGETSVLMFMFHHYLMAEGRPAWDALRRAQLWMLDPRRQPPDRMPEELRGQLDRTDPARVVGWAGFVHWGQ